MNYSDLFTSFNETVLMTLIATFLAYLVGLPLGMILYVTSKNGLVKNKTINSILGFIVNTLSEVNKTYNVGGKEIYTYNEMATMCFNAAKKEVKIKYVPKFLFTVLANLPKIKKAGKKDVILFSKFTLSHDLVGDTKIGDKSFKE